MPPHPGAPHPGVPGAPYPGVPGAPYPAYPGVPGAAYPGVPGAAYPGVPGAPYPGAAGAPARPSPTTPPHSTVYTPQPATTYSSAPNATRRPARRRALTIGILLTGFLLCWMVLAFVYEIDLGVQTASLAAALAVIPLLVVVPAFLSIDRLEAEPRRYLLFAFLFGALCASVGSLFLNTSMDVLFARSGVKDPDTWAAILSAPPVEEGLKGAAILLILLLRRKEFDGIIDGVVYAGLAGAGFAFSENILYLGRAYSDYGTRGLTSVFILRCVMAPFAHPLFTACTGIGLGLAASVARTRTARIGFGLGGYACAVLLHGIWNLSASAGTYMRVYVLFQVPVFIGFIVLLVMLRRRETRLVRQHLSQYADAGWLTHPEVGMLASTAARRAARTWAKGQSPTAAQSMRSFQDAASDLALLRSRMAHGAAEANAQEREHELLGSITVHRRDFAGRLRS